MMLGKYHIRWAWRPADWLVGWGVPTHDPDYPLWHLDLGPLQVNRLRSPVE